MSTTEAIGNLEQIDFFTYWATLFQSNPELFEREREGLIKQVILSASPENQENLWKLQWRIDAERIRAKNPYDAMLRLQKMMWEQFYADGGFLFAVNSFHIEKDPVQPVSQKRVLFLVKKD